MKRKIIIGLALGIVLALILNIMNFNNKDKAKLYFLPLKDADSSIITYKGKSILIDTGEDKDREILKETMKKLNIEKIDYMILTHPDKDHIGNSAYLIDNYEIGAIVQTDYNKKSDIQNELNSKIKEKNINNIIVKENYDFYIEELKVEIYPPEKEYEDSNNNSLIAQITLNNHKALYTGDIREERIKDILDNLEEVDLLKFPYHGRKNELAESLIKKTKPKITVITGINPDDSIINNLKNINSKIRLTNEQKVDITFE